MYFYLLLPAGFFLLLLIGEFCLPTMPQTHVHHRWDWLLNLIGFFMQGTIVPLFSFLIATQLLPIIWPDAKGMFKMNWYTAFMLNFVVIDFLYYWQHRLFHHLSWAWRWHQCHHSSARVDMWATARNSILTNFMFVYLLINPILGFLCSEPAGFFAGAALTASLDLLRHSNIDFERVKFLSAILIPLENILVLPKAHHRHHHALAPPANFAANLIMWDKLFGTYCGEHFSADYKDQNAARPLAQLLYPVKIIDLQR